MNKHYDYFMTLTKELNFRKASEKLYISQPALSKYISRLESIYGVTFFDRSTTPLKLTHAGELYRDYLENSNQLDKDICKKFQEIISDERGQIRIGLNFYRGSILLPVVLPVFQQRYPLVQVLLTEGNSPFLINELLNERIHFCISTPNSTLNYNLLSHIPIFEEKVYLGVSMSFPRLRQYVDNPGEIAEWNTDNHFPDMDIRKLQNEQFFLTQPYQSISQVVEGELSKNNIHLHNAFRTSNLYTAINLAAVGMGFCFIPASAIRQQTFPKNILFFHVENIPLAWEHAVFFKRDSYISIHCKRFLNIVREVYGQSPELDFPK